MKDTNLCNANVRTEGTLHISIGQNSSVQQPVFCKLWDCSIAENQQNIQAHKEPDNFPQETPHNSRVSVQRSYSSLPSLKPFTFFLRILISKLKDLGNTHPWDISQQKPIITKIFIYLYTFLLPLSLLY